MRIFPYDGTDRIRFAGLGDKAHSQPDASGSPKTQFVLRSEVIIANYGEMSRETTTPQTKIKDFCLLPSKGSLIASLWEGGGSPLGETEGENPIAVPNK